MLSVVFWSVSVYAFRGHGFGRRLQGGWDIRFQRYQVKVSIFIYYFFFNIQLLVKANKYIKIGQKDKGLYVLAAVMEGTTLPWLAIIEFKTMGKTYSIDTNAYYSYFRV